MELKDILNEYGIVGVISDYKESIDPFTKVSDIPIKNMLKAFKMVNLQKDVSNMLYKDLSLSEKFKVELASKLNNDFIIIGSLSKRLNNKDIEYMHKLFLKLNNDYHKKIVIIDNDVNIFFNLAKVILIIKDKKIIYQSNNFYDDEIYKYTKMPRIIEFIKYINKDKKVLMENTDIYELIKDIYRSVS